jgi:hypothetical protein
MTGAWYAACSPMTEPTTNDQVVTHFVRHTLGCGCPDEVFEHIRIDTQPEAFNGLPVDYLIDIGGRLLVAVCISADWRQLRQSLAAIVHNAREYRDRNGFNRFRLVVAAEETQTAQAALQVQFESAIADGDEKIHLHVLAPAALPNTASATMI